MKYDESSGYNFLLKLGKNFHNIMCAEMSNSDNEISGIYPIKRIHKTINIFSLEEASEMAPAYKLTYFNVTALGEPIRMLFHYGGIEFEDIRFDSEDWPKYKPNTPMGQVPMLEIDGKKYHQSTAIARMIARKVKLVGADELEDMEIDAMVDTLNDFRMKIAKYSYEQNEEYKTSLKGPLFEETIPMYLDKLDNFAKDNNGYLVLGKLTWADVFFVGLLHYLDYMTKMDLVANHSNLRAVKEHVLANPAIKKWVETRPKTDM